MKDGFFRVGESLVEDDVDDVVVAVDGVGNEVGDALLVIAAFCLVVHRRDSNREVMDAGAMIS